MTMILFARTTHTHIPYNIIVRLDNHFLVNGQ